MQAQVTTIASIGGVSMTSTAVRTGSGQIGQEVPIAAAKAGTLSLRTSDTVGTLTLSAGHGITEGQIIEVYWAAGRRYNVVAGVVAGNDVPISGGTGDVLPAQDTAVTAQAQYTIDMDVVGNLLAAIGAMNTQRGHLGFYNAAALILSLDLTASELWSWLSGGTAVNPFAGETITSIKATQASSTAAATLKIGALYDSDS